MTNRFNRDWPPHPPEWNVGIDESARTEPSSDAPRGHWIRAAVVGLVLWCLGVLVGVSFAVILLALWMVAVGLPVAVGRKPFGISSKLAGSTVLGAGLVLLVVGGALSPDAPQGGIGAPDPSPAAQSPLPSPTQPAKQPIAAGVFSGKAVVTQDVGMMHGDGEGLPPLGQPIPRTTLTLGQDCDSGAGRCTISHDFPGFEASAYQTLPWGLPDDGSLTATDVWHFAGECVAEDGNVVGAYDNTVTFSVVLRDPVRTVYGPGTWSTAEVTILIESVSERAGCDPATYEVQGHLLRQDDATVPASPPATSPLLTA